MLYIFFYWGKKHLKLSGVGCANCGEEQLEPLEIIDLRLKPGFFVCFVVVVACYSSFGVRCRHVRPLCLKDWWFPEIHSICYLYTCCSHQSCLLITWHCVKFLDQPTKLMLITLIMFRDGPKARRAAFPTWRRLPAHTRSLNYLIHLIGCALLTFDSMVSFLCTVILVPGTICRSCSRLLFTVEWRSFKW